MGSGGKGSKSSSSDNAAMNTLADISKQSFDISKPGLQEIISQGLEAWKTGGTSASLPMVQRAIESSKVAGSQALKGAEANIASSGLAGTPYAISQEAQMGMQNEFNTNNAANAVGQQIMNALIQGVTGAQSNAFQGLGNASQATASQLNTSATNATSKGNSQLGFLSTALFG
ncbi:MAG: hypothetical protein WC390_08545 [Sulfurimonas sp.]